MIISSLIAGLTLGVISSFHCVGMCGPLVMSLPVNHLSYLQRSLAIALYHMGRIGTYIILGCFFSTLGRGFVLAGFQQALSICLGIVLLLIAAYTLLLKPFAKPPMLRILYQPLQQMMGSALRSGNIAGFGFLGALNGLLPCGMVYLAVAGSLTAPSVSEGIAWMGMYGAGTVPAMLLLSVFSYRINADFRIRIKKLFPIVIVVMGVLLILRGMGLGIPFVSPILFHGAKDTINCH